MVVTDRFHCTSTIIRFADVSQPGNDIRRYVSAKFDNGMAPFRALKKDAQAETRGLRILLNEMINDKLHLPMGYSDILYIRGILNYIIWLYMS